MNKIILIFIISLLCVYAKAQEKGNTECENKNILAVLEDESGFIRYTTNPRVDRMCYYFFEPLISHKNFSARLYVKTNVGLGCRDDVLHQYVDKIVKINGHVTNRISSIEGINKSGYIVKQEYNVLEITSITEKK